MFVHNAKLTFISKKIYLNTSKIGETLKKGSKSLVGKCRLCGEMITFSDPYVMDPSDPITGRVCAWHRDCLRKVVRVGLKILGKL